MGEAVNANRFGLRWQSAAATPLSHERGGIVISKRLTRSKSADASDLLAQSKTWRTSQRPRPSRSVLNCSCPLPLFQD